MEVKDILEKVKIWREEAPSSLQLFNYIMQCFVGQEPIVGKPTLQFTFTAYKDGLGSELTPYQEKSDLFKQFYDKLKDDKNYFDNFVKPSFLIRKKLIDFSHKISFMDLTNLSDNDLADLYKQLHKLMMDFVVYGTYWEIIDPFTEELPELMQKKYGLDNKEFSNMVVLMSTPERRSFLTQEKIDFLNLCLDKMSIEHFHERYYWIDSNYKHVDELTVEEIKKRVGMELEKKTKDELLEEIRKTERAEKNLFKEKEEMAESVGIDGDDLLLFSLISRFGELIDLRKEGMIRSNYAKFQIIDEIAKRKNISVEDFMYFTEEEAINYLTGKNVDVNDIMKRKNLCFIYYYPGGEHIFVGNDAEELYDVYMKKILSSEFKGVVSYDPSEVVKGKVCKVIDTKKDAFEEGNILVTTMTRPEFMPLMRKSKAVITDEGGITCHAAIVSRELKIPCIIGAKIATKMLDNGDEIEMDFANGTVKVLSKG